jgi:polyferredoxin
LLTQVSTLVLLNLGFLNLRGFCAPVFYCHGCPLATFACPIGVMINFSALRIVPFITLGILGLVGVVGGRFVCGWMCPFGLFQDLLYKIRVRKIRIPRALTYTKYAVLAGLVFAVPYFLPHSPYTFCYFCPSASLESVIPRAFIAHFQVGGDFAGWAKFSYRIAILAAAVLFAMVASRGICRVFCPLGAIFALFNRFSLFRFNLAHTKCNSCGGCGKSCPVQIDPVEEMNTAECVRCLDCTPTGHIKIGSK